MGRSGDGKQNILWGWPKKNLVICKLVAGYSEVKPIWAGNEKYPSDFLQKKKRKTEILNIFL